MRPLWVLALLAGCDPLADNGYVGEPMFELSGTLAAPTSGDPLRGIALMWQDPSGAGGPGVAVTSVPVSLEFPSTFRVSVPLPPPAVARFTLDDVELGEAYVFVVSDPEVARPVPRGLDRTHVLVWASADVAADTAAAEYLGGPISAGYHLRRFASVTTVTGAQRAMIDRCASVSPLASCETRRAYALSDAADDEPLHIVVASQ